MSSMRQQAKAAKSTGRGQQQQQQAQGGVGVKKKRVRTQADNAKKRKNPAAIARISFLFEAAQLMAKQKNAPMARFYAASMRKVALKTTIRLSHEQKRSICKKCDSLLMLGRSCTSRIKRLRSGEKFLVKKCNFCGEEKRFLQPKDSKKKKAAAPESKTIAQKLAASAPHGTASATTTPNQGATNRSVKKKRRLN